GLKLGTAGILSIEAGIRSKVYRNLGGECRQTNLAGGAHGACPRWRIAAVGQAAAEASFCAADRHRDAGARHVDAALELRGRILGLLRRRRTVGRSLGWRRLARGVYHLRWGTCRG